MKRNIRELEEAFFDVVIIGGGIHGAATAWQCALQGLKVALIEKNDFGSATSANSLKIIHGGFRYLQHLNFKRMRESIVSRRIMSQISPHNVQALQCVIPNSGFGLRNRFLLRLALFFNDVIAFDRNRDINDECKIPHGESISLQQCNQLFPNIDWSGKTGGTVWYDAIALNSERLVLDFVKAATLEGSVVANYVEMKQLTVEDGKVTGCLVFDKPGNREISVRARSVVLAGGPNNDVLLGRYQSKSFRQKAWAKAVNIVIRKKLLGHAAIGLTGSSDYIDKDAVIRKKGRFFFFVPWRGYTMIGTTYSHVPSHPSEVKASNGDITDILEEVNAIFPQAAVSLADVTNVHTGLLPAYEKENENQEVQLVKETELFDLHKKTVNPVQGLFVVKSVKFTTAPVVGIAAAKHVMAFLRKKWDAGKDWHKINAHAFANSVAAQESTLNPVLQKRYGNQSERVASFIRKDDRCISLDPLLFAGEIDFFIEDEMVQTLADVVLRRSETGSAECPSRQLLEDIAKKMAEHFSWDEKMIAAQIKRVEDAFVWN